MNKVILTIIGTLLLTTGGFAVAQDNDGGQKRHRSDQQRGMQGMPVVDRVIRALKRLDLEEEQKTEVKAILQGMKEDLRPIMGETKAGQKQLKELITAETFDEDAIATIAEKEGDLAAERTMIVARAMSGVFALLTDEQRAELETMSEQRRERRSERRQTPTPSQDG